MPGQESAGPLHNTVMCRVFPCDSCVSVIRNQYIPIDDVFLRTNSLNALYLEYGKAWVSGAM